MAHIRQKKLEHQIKDEISLILLYKMRNPAFGTMTITDVKLSPDFKQAKIYFSVYEKEKRDLALESIRKAAGSFRSQLAARIKLRYVPELSFFIDTTLDYVDKIEGLLKEIHKDDNKSDENTDGV